MAFHDTKKNNGYHSLFIKLCLGGAFFPDTVYVSSYVWPALLTFGLSGNPALSLLVLNCHDCCLFELNKYLLLFLLLLSPERLITVWNRYLLMYCLQVLCYRLKIVLGVFI